MPQPIFFIVAVDRSASRPPSAREPSPSSSSTNTSPS